MASGDPDRGMVGDIRLSDRQDDRGSCRRRRARRFSLAGIVDKPAIGYRRRQRPAPRHPAADCRTTDRARRDRRRRRQAPSGHQCPPWQPNGRSTVAGSDPAAHAVPGIATRDHYDTKPHVAPRFDRTQCRLAGVQPPARQRLHPRDGGRDPRRHRRGAGRSRGARAGAGKRRPALFQRRRRPARLQGHRPGRHARAGPSAATRSCACCAARPSRCSPPSTARPWAAGWR